MTSVLSLSAHFPPILAESAPSLRRSTSALSASGSFPLLAALFVEDVVDAITTDVAIHMSLEPPTTATVEALPKPVAHVNPPKAEIAEASPAPADAPATLSAPAPDASEDVEYDTTDLDNDYYDDEDEPEDDYDYEDIERRVTHAFKLERRPKGTAHIPIRASKDDKEERVRPNRRVGHRLAAKMARPSLRRMENAVQRRNGRPPMIYWSSEERRPKTQEEKDMEEALRRSRRDGQAPARLSVQQLLDLQNRELTPEDYELLLMLDESVEKKKVSKDQFNSFSKEVLSAGLAVDCPVCMSPMATGETVTTLPCKHQYHTACIEQWLTNSSPNCPLDGLSLLHDH